MLKENQKLKPNPKTLVTAITFLLIGIVGTSFIWVYAYPSGGIFYISEGVYSGAPSYTYWRESSMFHAKNAYGRIDYFGTNASLVVRNSISNLPASGMRKIYFIGATYPMSGYLTLPSNIEVDGDREAILQATTAYSDARGILYAETEEYITIRNIQLDANFLATPIDLRNCDHVLIENTVAKNGGNPAVYQGLIRVHASGDYIEIRNNYVLNGNDGIVMNGATASYMNHIIIDGNTVRNTTDSIVPLLCKNLIVSNNVIVGRLSGGSLSASIGIDLAGSREYTITGNTIESGLVGIRARGGTWSSGDYQTRDVTITGNHITGMEDEGITLTTPFHGGAGNQDYYAPVLGFSITANTLWYNTRGIMVASGQDGTITGNSIRDGDDEGILLWNDNISRKTNNNITITANTISSPTGNQNYGIRFLISGTGVINNIGIHSNNIWGHANYGIREEGVRTVLIGNTVMDNTQNIGVWGSDYRVVGCWNGTNWVATAP